MDSTDSIPPDMYLPATITAAIYFRSHSHVLVELVGQCGEPHGGDESWRGEWICPWTTSSTSSVFHLPNIIP